MSPTPNPQYWLNKKAHRKTGFPLATIAYYGPDDTFASKVVVGIIPVGRRRTGLPGEMVLGRRRPAIRSLHRPANSRFHPGASR